MATGALNGEAVSPPQNGPYPKRSGTAPGPRFLDVEELAGWLGIEVIFVRRLVAERRIPFVKIGRWVRFDPEEIAAWIDSRRVPIERRNSRRMSWRD
jgi:excisionase family DNA binding protein